MASEIPPIVDVHLFDEVFLVDKAIGIVKFIGEIKKKNGLFFGIDLKKGKGINSGCIKNRRYFRTKNSKVTGRFTQMSKIIKSTKTLKSIIFTIGDKIQCPHLNTTAIIRYVGVPAFDKTMKTVYFGIELDEPKGDCNGELYSAYLGKKISYFKCEANHGLYIKSTDISVRYMANDNNAENMQNNYEMDDEKAIDNNKDDEIMRLRQRIETLQNSENEHQKILKEYDEYKQDTQRSNDQINEMERQMQEINETLRNKNEEIDQLKQELNENKSQKNEYEQLLVEFNEYKQQNDDNKEQDEQNEQDAEEMNELKLQIKKLSEANSKLKEKYKKSKQKVLSLTGNHLNNSGTNTLSTEYLEKELADLKAKQKNKKSKQRISGVLAAFAATDVKSATIILKEILKQWESQFISKKARVDYLKNFEQILGVIGNSIDMNKKNAELDPIVKKVVNIIQKCRDDNDDALRNMAAELCQNDIILQFMMR